VQLSFFELDELLRRQGGDLLQRGRVAAAAESHDAPLSGIHLQERELLLDGLPIVQAFIRGEEVDHLVDGAAANALLREELPELREALGRVHGLLPRFESSCLPQPN